MSDIPPNTVEAAGIPEADSMAAFSDKLQDIKDAVDLLYIRYNASGRNKFRDKYPQVALYIFGEQLIKYDNEGAQDLNHRIQLEQEADDRRIEFKMTLSEIVEKSVDKGVLQSEYVGQVIDRYGLEISRLLYAENIIGRVRPNLMSENESEQAKEDDFVEEKKLSQEEKSLLSNVVDENSDANGGSKKLLGDEKQNRILKSNNYKDIFNSISLGKL